MKKIEIGQEAQVLVVWNTDKAITTKEEEKNIASAMAKKYGIPVKHVHVYKNFVTRDGSDGVLAGEIVQNINDPRFMQELMKQYMAINKDKMEGVDFEDIVKIDSLVNAQVDFSLYNQGKKYSIKWVKWGNFLSYGPDNFFDFTKLHGLVLLNGNPANKSGKSTFAYDLLHFLLFGKTNTKKAKTLGGLFNNYLPDEKTLNVEGCINIDGDDYIIRRTLTRSSGKKQTVTNKVEYFKIKKDGTEELLSEENKQGASTTQTTKIIKDAIGNESDFDLIISANAKDLDSLISLTETERGRLLSRWIGLSIIEDKDVIARNKWNREISIGRFCDMYNRKQLEAEIEELNSNNDELNEIVNTDTKKIDECNKNIEAENKIRDALLSSKQAIDPSLTSVDVETLKVSIESIVADGKRRAAEKEQIDHDIKAIGDVDYSEDDYNAMKIKNDKLIEKMAEARSSIKHLQETNKSLANSEFCPLCHRKFDDIDNSGTIKKNEEEIKKITESGLKMKAESEKLSASMSEIAIKRTLLHKKSQLELKSAAIETHLSTQRVEYTEKKNLLSEIRKNEETIRKNNEIDTKLNVVNENIRAQEKIKRENEDEIKMSNISIAKNNESIALKQSYIVKIDEEIKVEKTWKAYLQMIGKDGISKMVLRNTLPIINNELNRLLSDVTDFSVEIVMNEKNDVDFLMIRDGVVTMLSAASGLETTQAALALRVVLGKMSRLSRPPFILLDEILGTVAKENYDDMKRLYDKIVSEFEFVLHICHIDLDWYDEGGVITVVKKDNISYIQNQ